MFLENQEILNKVFSPLYNSINVKGYIPNMKEVLQATTGSPVYNSDSGYYEFKDAKGKIDKTPLESNVFYFEGDDDYVDLGNILNFGEKDFTIEIELQEDPSQTTHGGLVTKGTWDTADGFTFHLFNGTYPLLYVNGSAVSAASSGIDCTDGEYHKFRVTRVGDVFSIYHNDETTPVVQETRTGVNISSSVSAYIGARGGTSPNNFFKGIISNVKIYNEDDKLIHAWHCDETAGDFAYDSIEEWYKTISKNAEMIDSSLDNVADYWFPISTNGDITYSNANNMQKFYAENSNSTYYSTGISSNLLKRLIEGQRYKTTFKIRGLCPYGVDSRIGSSSYSATVHLASAGELSETEWLETSIVFTANSTQASGYNLKMIFASGYQTGNWVEIDYFDVQRVYEPVNGTLEGIYAPTFFTTDNRFKSYQNDIGYSEDATSNNKVLNFDFSDGDGTDPNLIWSQGSSWEIIDSKAVGDGGTSWLHQSDLDIELGERVFITLDVVVSSGYVGIVPGSAGTRTDFSSTQVVSYSTIWDGTNNRLAIYGYTFSGHINSIIVKRYPESLIPIALNADEESTKLDILGSTPTYNGRTKNNLKIVDNSCLSFTGTNYVNLGNQDMGLRGNEPFKFRFRIKTSNASGQQIFTKKIPDGTQRGIAIRLNAAGDLIVDLFNSTVSFIRTGTTLFNNSNGEWHSYEIEYDGTNADGVSITIDGNPMPLNVQRDDLVGVITNDEDNIIGAKANGTSCFKGLIDYLEMETPNKTYTYNFGEGAGDFAYDRVLATYSEELFTGNITGSTSEWEETDDAYVLTKTGSGFQGLRLNIGEIKTGETMKLLCDVTTDSTNMIAVIGGASETELIKLTNGENIIELTSTGAAGGDIFIYNASNEVITCSIVKESLSIKQKFNPINGTLTGTPIWVTNDKATPNNLLSDFNKGIYCNKGGARTINSVDEGFQEYETTFYLNKDINSATEQQILTSFANFQSANYFRVSLGVSTGLLDNEIITVMDKNNGNNFRSCYCSTKDVIKKGWHTLKVVHTGGSTNYAIYLDGTRVDNEYSGLNCPVHDVNYVTLGDSSIANLPFNGSITNAKLTTTEDVYEWNFGDSNTSNVPCNVIDYNAYNYGYKIINIPTSASTFNNLAGKWHNNAESKLEEYKVSSLFRADLIGDNPIKYLYGELLNTDKIEENSYSEFTTLDNTSFKAVSDGTGNQAMATPKILLEKSKEYIVRFNLKLNSGTLPNAVRFRTSLGGTTISNNYTPVEGYNVAILIPTIDGEGVLQMYNNGTATDFLLTQLSIKRVLDDTPTKMEYRNIGYDTYELDPYHIMFNNAEVLKKRNMLVYDKVQDVDNLTKIYKFIKDKVLRDENGDPILDGDGNVIYTE